jgi:hypothetical protein
VLSIDDEFFQINDGMQQEAESNVERDYSLINKKKFM